MSVVTTFWRTKIQRCCPWVGYRVELKNVLKFTVLWSELGLGKALNRDLSVAEKWYFFSSGENAIPERCFKGLQCERI